MLFVMDGFSYIVNCELGPEKRDSLNLQQTEIRVSSNNNVCVTCVYSQFCLNACRHKQIARRVTDIVAECFQFIPRDATIIMRKNCLFQEATHFDFVKNFSHPFEILSQGGYDLLEIGWLRSVVA
jgi:hypothetical protein